MQRLLVACGIFAAVFRYCDAQIGGQNLYSKRYERLDIDTILASPRLVTNYVECLLNRKPCPPEGKDLKRILPEALRTKCGRCWPSQKEGAIKVITKLYYDYPDQYNALRARWDPTGEYHRRFQEYLRDHQFNVISGNGIEADINRGDQSQISVTVAQANGSPNFVTAQQTTATTARVPTVPTIDPDAQRPTREDGTTAQVQRDEVPSFIANRFGDDPTEFQVPTTRRTTVAPSTGQRPSSSASTSSSSSSSNQFNTNYQIGQEPTYTTFQTRNPILNLINRLTLKFTNTAEFLAGMVRNTLKRT